MLRACSASAIVAAIADAAERWRDADFAPRVRVTQAIQTRLGYTLPVVDYALDRLFSSLHRGALETTIAAELGALAALDGPIERRDGSSAYARGVDLAVIVSSDTTIGVGIVPAVYALCAKCDVVVKDRNDALVQAFFETLVDERPEFRVSAVARGWSGGHDPDEAELLRRADVVVAFGADATLGLIRTALRPDARFVPFAHRVSIGYLDASMLGEDGRQALFDGIATDALLYDGAGCMSLHALFIAGTDPDRRAAVSALADGFERMSVEFPAGTLDAGRAASAAAYRNLGTFRAAGGRGAIYAPAAQTATLAFDPPPEQPPPLLPRVLPVFPVSGAADVVAYVRRHRLPVETLAVADTRVTGALALAEAVGAVRIARLGTMQAPPASGHHGGAARIADFVRWIDRE